MKSFFPFGVGGTKMCCGADNPEFCAHSPTMLKTELRCRILLSLL